MASSLPFRILGAACLALLIPTRAATQPAVSGGVHAIVQSYSTGDDAIREVSVPVTVAAEVVPGVSLSLRTAYASAGGDVEPLSGLTDTRLGVRYRRDVLGALIDVGLTGSLPTGRTALSEQEFATAAALSFDDYAFALPSLGQGAVVSPSISASFPIAPGAALGLGASYTSRGGYTLFDGDASEYTPADETVLTAGLDAVIGGASTVTLEGSYVRYGDDGYRDATFSPGDKVAGTLRLDLGAGMVRGDVLARYRHVLDGQSEAGSPVAYLRPSQARVAVGLGVVHPAAAIRASAGVRYYGSLAEAGTLIGFASTLAEQQVLLDLGLAPSFAVTPNVALALSATYTQGLAEAIGASPLTGYRVSGGLSFDL